MTATKTAKTMREERGEVVRERTTAAVAAAAAQAEQPRRSAEWLDFRSR